MAFEIPKHTCLYYDEVFRVCEDNDECVITSCKKYVNKYVKKDCRQYKSESNSCRILIDSSRADKYAPCCFPRIKKNGEPVKCTFYKKGGDCDV